MQPGLYFDLPMRDYLAEPALSKHALDALHRSPMEYRLQQDGLLTVEQSPAMLFGSLLHGLVLEDRQDWITPPATYPSEKGEKPWTMAANYCKAWRDEQTMPIVSREDEGVLLGVAESVRKDPLASQLLTGGHAEVSMFAEYDGRPCKGRADYLNTHCGYFVDLKTTTDASTAAFSREIVNRRYEVQFALYWKLLAVLGYKILDTYFIAVEKTEPYRVNVRKLKSSALEVGQQELDADLELLETCERTNTWPGLSGKGPGIAEIDIPLWKYSAGEALELTVGGKSLSM
jgi:exodeoxyribonuclease VIII